MADTQNTQQKYFLDLAGLTTLWGKIKSTFADKAATETSIGEINVSLGNLDTKIKTVDISVDTLETSVLSFVPRPANYYSDAIDISKSVLVGTMIELKSGDTSAEDPTPSGYLPGIYIVYGPEDIKLISTSDGDLGGSDITAIDNRVKALEDITVKSAQIIDQNGNSLNQSFDVTDNVLLIAHDDVFDIDTNSVKALTHRAVAAKFKTLQEEISLIPHFKVAVVEDLPTSNISLSTIYLKKNSSEYDKNLFTEYIYVEKTKDDPSTEANESQYVWEKLGEQTLVVDDFVTDAELVNAINSALQDYAKTADVKSLVKEETDKLREDIVNELSDTYATKESVNEVAKDVEDLNNALGDYLTKNDAAGTYLRQDVAESTYFTKDAAENSGWMTEGEIIISIQTGEIGKAIAITNEQIENMTTANNQ